MSGGGRCVIYTSLTGGVDNLPVYDVLDSRFDYVCFSDDYPAGSRVGQWEIRPIPVWRRKNNVLRSRFAKLQPHRLLGDYEWSVWLDANVIVTGAGFYDIVDPAMRGDKLWCGVRHPWRDCAYDEARACLVHGKAGYFGVRRAMSYLHSHGHPRHYGLFENNLILRCHNDPAVVAIDNEWWRLFRRCAQRDQLSLFHVFRTHSFAPGLLLEPEQCTRNVPFLRWVDHRPPVPLKGWPRLRRSLDIRLQLMFMKIRPIET